jgi:hypothetical protein
MKLIGELKANGERISVLSMDTISLFFARSDGHMRCE